MINHRLVWTQGIFSVDENKIWFVPYWINVLCVYNLKTNKMEKTIHFPDQDTDSAGYYSVKKMDELVAILPAFEKRVYIYDTTTDVVSSFDLPAAKCQCEKFLFASVWNQNIYLFPVGYEYVVKINLQERKLKAIDTISDKCKMFVAMTQIDEKAYLVNETNQIYIFDMSLETFKTIECEDTSRKYRTITHQGTEKLILTDTTGNLYIQYLDDGNCEKYVLAENILYDSSLCVADDIFLMPAPEKDYFVRVDINSKSLSKHYINGGDNYIKWAHAVFSKAVCKNHFLYFFSTQYRMLYVYDIKTEKETAYQLEMPAMSDREIEELLRDKRNRGSIKEGSGQHAVLEKFIALAKKDGSSEMQGEAVGDKIYRITKG